MTAPGSVLLFTRSLEFGGAQRQLCATATGLRRRGVDVSVLAFYSGGEFAEELAAAGIPVEDLGKQGRWDVLSFIPRLVRALRRRKPAALYSFLVVPNILAVLARPLLPGTRMVWSLRASYMDLGRYDRLAGISAWFEKRLARRADAIVCNSEAGRSYHAGLGYPERLIEVVYNGIDTDRFTFDEAGRERVRKEWGVTDDELLVGLVARLDPMKDHPVFIEALSLLQESLRSRMRFVCIGDGPEEYAAVLRARAEMAGVADRLAWVPFRTDMPAVYSACDIAVSSSYGEGFSNVIAEAMSCRCPCVATDVGDSARIIGDTGRIVKARSPRLLADALAGTAVLPQRERLALGVKARQRVVREYGMDRMIERTGKVLRLW